MDKTFLQNMLLILRNPVGVSSRPTRPILLRIAYTIHSVVLSLTLRKWHIGAKIPQFANLGHPRSGKKGTPIRN
jgi:hypothetical protein